MTTEINYGCHTSHPYNVCPACVEKAIAKAVAEERERCAQVAEVWATKRPAGQIAAAIRKVKP